MRLYLRGEIWWIQSHDRRVSTGCSDKVAAQLWALSYERAAIIIDAMKGDAFLREHIERYVDETRRDRCRGWVYGIQVGNRVKIGFTSRSPIVRLGSLQTGQSVRLHLVAAVRGTRKDERSAHVTLKHARLSGEWFDAEDPKVAAWIQKHRYENNTIFPARRVAPFRKAAYVSPT